MPENGYRESCKEHRIVETWCSKHEAWEFWCPGCKEWIDHNDLYHVTGGGTEDAWHYNVQIRCVHCDHHINAFLLTTDEYHDYIMGRY